MPFQPGNSERLQRLSGLSAQSKVNSHWLSSKALELWAGNGFDPASEQFEERLTFERTPIRNVPRRVMVQARQSATFAVAALSGRFEGGAVLAIKAGRSMVRNYLKADGSAGWVFSLDPAGRVADSKRDLYAHAFVLFSLAWLIRIEPDARFLDAVDQTLQFLDSHFADPVHGGYWDSLPRFDSLRRQNPHMHLFEALIELYESCRSEEILARCKRISDLSIQHFIDPESGALREYYHDDWTVSPAPGQGSVEPGHLFEWAWLLRRYEKISGENLSQLIQGMLDLALRAGTDHVRGRIADEMDENGNIRSASSRSWPHAEALKALSMETALGHADHLDLLTRILRRITDVYCKESLHGGWIDHVNERDEPISHYMPASTLYHLYFGITSVEDLIGKIGTSSPE